jgi:hypothetical protein
VAQDYDKLGSCVVLNRIAAIVVIAFTALASSSVALAASGSVQIPEPGDAALFVIAVAGLILGRHASRRAPRHDDDKQA